VKRQRRHQLQESAGHVFRRRNRFLIPTLSLRLKHHDVSPSPKTVSVTHAKPSVFASPALCFFQLIANQPQRRIELSGVPGRISVGTSDLGQSLRCFNLAPASVGAFVLGERHRDNSFARAATSNLKLQKKAAPASRSRKLTTLILFLAHTSLCSSGHRSTAWPPLYRWRFRVLDFDPMRRPSPAIRSTRG